MKRTGKEVIKILHIEDLPADDVLVERELIKAKVVFEKMVVDSKLKFENVLDSFYRIS